MTKYLKYFVMILIGVPLILLALANRGAVDLYFLPAGLAGAFGLNAFITLPLFLVIFAGVLIGLVIGLIWEALRGLRTRFDNASKQRELARMQREIDSLRESQDGQKNEILALID